MEAGVTQVPVPLQVEAGCSVEPVQLAPMQVVPDGNFWKAPFPSHRPSVEQVEAPAFEHWVAGTGACPAVTAVYVPEVPLRLHAVQVPVQALLQQTPFAQKPLTQAAPVAHVLPCGSLPQLPRLHIDGDVQSVLEAQVVLQTALVVSQANGSQSVEVTVLQLPAPSQVRAGVSVSPVQLPATHCVPLT